MVEVISRNGNFLINIGPKEDGTIPEPQVERLQAMGDWLKINADAIYGSRYWKVFEQKDEHLAFTTNGSKLYAIKMKQPDASFTIAPTAGWTKTNVKSVKLLGSAAEVKWEITPQGLAITPPADLGNSQYAWAFEIVTNQQLHVPNVIQNDPAKALKGTKAVDLEGYDFSAVPNVAGSSVVTEASATADGFKKLVPQQVAGTFTTNQKTANDPVAILGDGKLSEGSGPIFKNGVRDGAYKMDLGSVKSVSAVTSWSHNAKGFRGNQKLVLFGSNAASDPGWNLSKFTPLGTIDTSKETKAKFHAASLRAAEGKSLGKFRWIVWAVSPISNKQENTAFQELSVEFKN